jgi:hypothetical protein
MVLHYLMLHPRGASGGRVGRDTPPPEPTHSDIGTHTS